MIYHFSDKIKYEILLREKVDISVKILLCLVCLLKYIQKAELLYSIFTRHITLEKRIQSQINKIKIQKSIHNMVGRYHRYLSEKYE
jgi:hypothetical protein